VTAGTSTYPVGGINPDQVKPIIDVAIAQFRALQRLRDELHSTRVQLEERTLIQQDTRLLRAHPKIGEDDARRLLTKLAMHTNQRLPAVAKTVLATLSPKTSDKGKRST